MRRLILFFTCFIALVSIRKKNDLVAPILQEGGFDPFQDDLYVAHCPERVLPGRILIELIENTRIVGGLTPKSAAKAAEVYRAICTGDVVETEAVTIESGTTTIMITWPTETGADTYTIVIQKGDEVFCTLTFNAEGQLLNIAFTPGRNGNHPVQYAEQAGNGYRFTITGLEDGTDYTYDIVVKNEAGKVIKTHSGKFTTIPMAAVDNIHSPSSNNTKLLRDGQLIIIRDGKTYNAQGALLK